MGGGSRPDAKFREMGPRSRMLNFARRGLAGAPPAGMFLEITTT